MKKVSVTITAGKNKQDTKLLACARKLQAIRLLAADKDKKVTILNILKVKDLKEGELKKAVEDGDIDQEEADYLYNTFSKEIGNDGYVIGMRTDEVLATELKDPKIMKVGNLVDDRVVTESIPAYTYHDEFWITEDAAKALM